MTAKIKIELSCRRCGSAVICDVADDDDGDPSAVRAGSPNRPPNWNHVVARFGSYSVREYGDLCPGCTADFIRFMRGHVVDLAETIPNARGPFHPLPGGHT